MKYSLIILVLFANGLVFEKQLCAKKTADQWKTEPQHIQAIFHKAKTDHAALQIIETKSPSLRSLVAICKNYSRLSNFAKNKKESASYAKAGWKTAQQMIQKYPLRAEGYYWAALLIGMYANKGGIWVAIQAGVATKLRKYAEQSIALDPYLYKGRSQRLLGRFYYKLPWPMKNLKKSLYFLEEAFKQNPKNVWGLVFLAETLLKQKKTKKALRYLQRCETAVASDMLAKLQKQKCFRLLEKWKNK